MQYHIKAIVLSVFLGTIFHASADSEAFGITVGMLNKGFRTFIISRDAANNNKISILKYKFPPQGLESDSKQNMLGVAFFVEEDGKIVSIQPMVVQRPLPDQKAVNLSIDSGEKASDFFLRSGLEKLNEIQTYGLLSKWAVAVLSRKNEVRINLDLKNEQKIKILRLFNDKVKIPDLSAINEVAADKSVEIFAKDIIRYSPY